MNNFLKIFSIFILTTVAFSSVAGNKLKSSKTKGIGPMSVKIPYTKVVDYFGYVSKDIKPDGKYKNKDAYYLYIWVPAVIDEVGVSMYSPADKKPKKNAFVHPAFNDNYAKDKKAFFDTYLVLEKLAIVEASKIKNGGKVVSELDKNDDSSEMGKNPSGSKYNSLLRHESQMSQPTKALTRGVYRITFTSFRGSVQGSYVASVGTMIPGVVIAASLEELHNAVNK